MYKTGFIAAMTYASTQALMIGSEETQLSQVEHLESIGYHNGAYVNLAQTELDTGVQTMSESDLEPELRTLIAECSKLCAPEK